ncbi:winged helix-turn-helix domain-containing protein [Chroococcidiopsis sp. CCMEE 29]|uniref:winged helix-turn-helix domain-containing protein n=1 Tax=Chroococcidiopsis sp. CCMEE 29 TaxID=155894 RepID=UPI002020B995|nr:winged helix-turn-helix domain-containing protein [Chroococcidiopsis sp. CCMEE 29]
MSQVLQQRWQISLKDSRIYEILDELGVSYQKVHRDYANAEPMQQQAFVQQVKKTGILLCPRKDSVL